MNYIDKIFNRCNIEAISIFLLHGAEAFENNTESFYERRKKADEKLSEWLEKQFPDIKENNEQGSFIYSVISEVETVYMQIGMQAGIRLAMEFYNKQNTK